MARPPKRGLDYYPKDTGYYNDYKIMDLLEEYGPLGQTIYDVILTLVYREGYYLAISENMLVRQILRLIGNKWIKNKDLVSQVIHYCADIGLLDDALLQQNVITSVGIQRRYAEVTVRNKVDKSKYWLIGGSQSSDSIPDFKDNVTETSISATETKVSAKEMPTKKTKENKSKLNETAIARARDALSAAVLRAFEDIRPFPTEKDCADLITLLDRYGEFRVLAAIKDAYNKGGKSVAYVTKILEGRNHQKNLSGNGRYDPTYTIDEVEEAIDTWID